MEDLGILDVLTDSKMFAVLDAPEFAEKVHDLCNNDDQSGNCVQEIIKRLSPVTYYEVSSQNLHE